MLEVDAENRAGRLVRIADGQVRLEREHAGRQARQDDFEVGAFGFHEGLRSMTPRAGPSRVVESCR